MNELFSLQHKNPQEETEKDWARRFLPWMVAAFLFSLLGGMAILYGWWSHYSTRYGKVSQASASFQANDEESVYSNPDYGMKLRLPGKWQNGGAFADQQICNLFRPDGFTAMFRVRFPVFSNAEELAQGMVWAAGLKKNPVEVVDEWPVDVNGSPGYVLEMEDSRKNRLVMVIVTSGPVAYILNLTGPQSAEEEWDSILEAISEAIEIE